MKFLDIQESTKDEVIASQNLEGIFYIKEETIPSTLENTQVLNLFIHEDQHIPFWDICLSQEKAKALIRDVFLSKNMPYCEVATFLFERPNNQVNNCMCCYAKCPFRMINYKVTDVILETFKLYCKNIYENSEMNHKKIQVALAKGWDIDTDMETLAPSKITEEELLREFIEGDLHNFVSITQLLYTNAPQYLHDYLECRVLPLKEMLVDKYTTPW